MPRLRKTKQTSLEIKNKCARPVQHKPMPVDTCSSDHDSQSDDEPMEDAIEETPILTEIDAIRIHLDELRKDVRHEQKIEEEINKQHDIALEKLLDDRRKFAANRRKIGSIDRAIEEENASHKLAYRNAYDKVRIALHRFRSYNTLHSAQSRSIPAPMDIDSTRITTHIKHVPASVRPIAKGTECSAWRCFEVGLPSRFRVGNMEHACPHCGALYFLNERLK